MHQESHICFAVILFAGSMHSMSWNQAWDWWTVIHKHVFEWPFRCPFLWPCIYILLYIDMYTWSLQSTYLLAVGQIISNYIICQEMTSNSISSDLPSNKNRLRRVPSGSLVYISIDIDGLDPSIAPGTGTPSHGGCLYYEVKDMGRWGNGTRRNHNFKETNWHKKSLDKNKGTTPWGGRGFDKSLWSWNVWSSAT